MKPRARTAIILALTTAAVALGGVVAARARATTNARVASTIAAPADTRVEIRVPHLNGAIALDGDMDDSGWQGPIARSGAFVDRDGNAARPYSDARFVWGDGHLYVALYAADEDIRATRTEPDAPLWLDDAFHLAFDDGSSERSFDVSPLGTLTDARRSHGAAYDYSWQSGAHVSHELDGTPNQSDDDDEEWVIEMAIPFESLGLKGEAGERIAVSVRRCDTPHRGARVCASWGENERIALVLE